MTCEPLCFSSQLRAKVQELLTIPGFPLGHLFQQLMLSLGSKNSAPVFAKPLQREAGTVPLVSAGVRGLSRCEVAVLPGYPAWDILRLCPRHTSSTIPSRLPALFLGGCLLRGCWGGEVRLPPQAA